MSAKQSKFVWYELMTSDTQAAAAFYRSVFGWDAKDAGVGGGPYSIFSVSDVSVGGLMAIPENACAAGAKSAWAAYVWVEDVDAGAARVKAAGGSIHRAPEDIPGVGRFAVVADPHGAVFMLFREAGGPVMPPVAQDALGHVGWHELHAGDGASAFAFYAGMFGWTKSEAVDMGAMGIYQTFATGGATAVGGMMTKMPETPAPFWLFYFNVDAIDAAVGRVLAAGGKLIYDPMQVPGGRWIVNCLDPQGAIFAMVAPKR